ncbi:MAG: hypothetical protein JKY15_04635 [Deltaproteobacteria bacterium]|nr:hypothetical protein [Deltaproteobacteria bacterium]
MSCCGNFWTWIVPTAAVWWLIASALLFYTWNEAISKVTSARKIQFKHALLLVITMAVLCAPSYMRGFCGKGGCPRVMQMMKTPAGQ